MSLQNEKGVGVGREQTIEMAKRTHNQNAYMHDEKALHVIIMNNVC